MDNTPDGVHDNLRDQDPMSPFYDDRKERYMWSVAEEILGDPEQLGDWLLESLGQHEEFDTPLVKAIFDLFHAPKYMQEKQLQVFKAKLIEMAKWAAEIKITIEGYPWEKDDGS